MECQGWRGSWEQGKGEEGVQDSDTGAKQYCIPSNFELELPASAKSCFSISQPSCFPVNLELRRTCGCKRKTCKAKSLPNRWVSSGNHQGVSFSFHSHPSFTWVPVTHCKNFGRGISQDFDPFMRQLVQTCSTRLLLSRAPTPFLSYSDYPFGIHHISCICNLWAGWSFKEQTHLECPWRGSIFNLTNMVPTF